MKMYNIMKGQISLELIMLILAVVVGTVVAGTMMPNNIFNTASVEDSKEVVFEGFIKGGGTPVYAGGGNGTSDSITVGDNNTTGGNEGSGGSGNEGSGGSGNGESGEDGNGESGEGNNETTTTGGGRAENLEIILRGCNMNSEITSEVIPGGEPLSGEVYETIFGSGRTIKYNVEGNITGKIDVNGTDTLQLGNLSEVGNLKLKLDGNSNLSLNGLGIGTLDIDNNGNPEITISSSNISTMNITRIFGNGKLILNDTFIETLNVSNMEGGRPQLEIFSSGSSISYVHTIHIKKMRGSEIIINLNNVHVEKLIVDNVEGYAKIIINNSIVDDYEENKFYSKTYINSCVNGVRYD